ncbi:unnamed protein product [Fusarium graminearum]|nr:unnamed protein product [Fusarium graminearum]
MIMIVPLCWYQVGVVTTRLLLIGRPRQYQDLASMGKGVKTLSTPYQLSAKAVAAALSGMSILGV